MAVYTRLELTDVARLWTATGERASVRAIAAMPQGSINTTYRVELDDGRLVFLRVNEGKTRAAIEREAALLDVLARASLGVDTPRLLGPRVEVAGKVASFFAGLRGDDLAPADVTPGRARQLGAFLARAHAALRSTVHVRTANPFSVRAVGAWLREVSAHPAAGPLRARHDAALALRRPLPRGTIHGDLFVDNTKWEGDHLAAVFDWEMAGTDHLARDVAICVNAWSWRGDRYDSDVARALVDGYQSVRRLAVSERRGLFVEAVLAAVRFAVTRIRDFEMNAAKASAERTRLDYTDYVRRLDALDAMRAKGFRAMVGLA